MNRVVHASNITVAIRKYAKDPQSTLNEQVATFSTASSTLVSQDGAGAAAYVVSMLDKATTRPARPWPVINAPVYFGGRIAPKLKSPALRNAPKNPHKHDETKVTQKRIFPLMLMVTKPVVAANTIE